MEKEPVSKPVAEHQDDKIYQFMKGNFSVLAGAGTAVIAAISAMISLGSYIYECAKLRYWGIDLAFIKTQTTNSVYVAVSAFVFLCVLLVSFFLINSISEKSIPMREKTYYLKHVKKELRKESFRVYLQKAISHFFHKKYDSSLEFHAKNAEVKIAEQKRKFAILNRNVHKEISIHLLLLTVVLTYAIFLLLELGAIDFFGSLWKQLICSALVSIIVLLWIWLAARVSLGNKKSIREIAHHDYINSTFQTKPVEIVLPLGKLFSGNFSFRQPDSKIKQALIKMVILLVFVSFAFSIGFHWMGYSKASNQKTFLVTDQSGMEYVVLYNNGESAIVAPCESSNGILTVRNQTQKVIPIEGLSYEICSFQEVILAPKANNLTE